MTLPPDSSPKYRDYIDAARTRAPSRQDLDAIARRVEERVEALEAAQPAQALSSTQRIAAGVLGGALVVALVIVLAPRRDSTSELSAIPSTSDSRETMENVETTDSTDSAALDPSPPSMEPEEQPDEMRLETALPQLPREPRPPRNASRSPESRREVELHGASEIALIEAAEAALLTHPRRAFELVTEHERAFPHGGFVEEREVLAVDALSRLRRTEAARTRAERFQRQHPNSAYTRRLERILSRMESGGAP